MKIILPPDMAEALAAMSDAEASALFRRLVQQAVERQREISRKRSEAGRKGGAPLGNQNALKQTNENKQIKQNKQKDKEQEKEKKQKNKEEEKEVLLERVDKTAKRFVPPQLEEIRAFVLEKNYEIDPDVFYNYYEANGWRIGRTPMRNWRAAVAQWNAREKAQQPHPGPPRTGEGVLSYQHSNNNRYANNQTSTIFSHSTRSGGCSPSGNEGVGGSYRGGLRPTTAELTVQSAAQAIANLQHRRASPLADVLGW